MSRRIDKDVIQELAALLEETGLSEIEIEKNNFRVRVRRETTVVTAPVPAAPQAQSEKPAAEPEPTGFLVTSPMVGTAYLAPEPGADPFVRVGTKVAEGTTLLIIEAMKTMNYVSSTQAGVVKEIFVEDGQPVEFGEALLSIE